MGRQPGAAQTPETIDDAPPPFESSIDENQQEEYESPQTKVEHAPQSHQSRGMAFPPQGSQPNASQPNSQFPPQAFPPPQDHEPQAFPPQSPVHQPQAFPPPQHEPQAFPQPQGQPQAFPPPQPEPQAFPPPQGQPQAFPPPQHEPQAFPPPHGQPQAFPPPQGGQTQAFPPPQGGQPQAFPPPQGQQPQAFPPTQEGMPQAFPPPQAEVHSFPPQAGTFQHQNVHQYQQPAGFSTMGTGTTGIGQSPMHHANSPLLNSNPQVFNNTPMTGFPVGQSLPTEPWKTQLFECMDDPTNALITCCFPCVTFGQIAEIIDSGQTSCSTSALLYGCIACFIALPCLLSCTYRTKLRARFGLLETPAPDWLVHCFCEPCALCQEYRELQKRGIDPSIGWLGHVAKSQQMVQMNAMTPPPKQNMMG